MAEKIVLPDPDGQQQQRWRQELEAAEVVAAECLQCGKCSAGCPAAAAMERGPRQLMLLAKLGLIPMAIASRGIWLCTACYSCSARCPAVANPAGLLEWLRWEAVRAGVAENDEVYQFHRQFLQSLDRHGRVWELGLALGYGLRSKRLSPDLQLGPALLRRGKLRFRPHRVSDPQSWRRWFRRCREEDERR